MSANHSMSSANHSISSVIKGVHSTEVFLFVSAGTRVV
jgi:hypothetical protein